MSRMEGVSYSPAVHTQTFLSKYKLPVGEVVVDVYPIQKEIFVSDVDIGWGRKNPYTFHVRSCLFLTNFGRLLPSLPIIEDIEMHKIMENGYDQRSFVESLRWSYIYNKVKCISSLQKREDVQLLFDKIGLDRYTDLLDIEEFTGPIRIEHKPEAELLVLREIKKKYESIQQRIQQLKNDLDYTPDEFFDYIELVLLNQEEVEKNLEELNEWRIYKKVKSKLYNAEKR